MAPCVVCRAVAVGRLQQVGCVQRWFLGVCVGGKTGVAVAERRVDRQRGVQNNNVVASTCRWRGVFGLGRVATLGCGVNEGGALGGAIGCFGGRNNFEAAWTPSSC